MAISLGVYPIFRHTQMPFRCHQDLVSFRLRSSWPPLEARHLGDASKQHCSLLKATIAPGDGFIYFNWYNIWGFHGISSAKVPILCSKHTSELVLEGPGSKHRYLRWHFSVSLRCGFKRISGFDGILAGDFTDFSVQARQEEMKHHRDINPRIWWAEWAWNKTETR